MSEMWKPVVGYEGIYEVSSAGRVKRIKTEHGVQAGRQLKPFSDRRGYPTVGLYKNRKRRMLMVHRLLTTTFWGPLPIGKQTNHKNGIKADNRLENLEFVTPSENTKHAYAHGLMHPCSGPNLKVRGENHARAKLTEQDVWDVRRRLSAGESWQSIANSYDVSKSAIQGIKNGKNWGWLK